MKRRKSVVVVFLLAAAMMLSVGYATLTDTLTIDGSAGVDADHSQDVFDKDIYFSKVISGDGCTAVIKSDPDMGTITVTEGALKEVGDEVIATYTIKSESDLPVYIPKPDIDCTNPEYFTVSQSWAVNEQTLAPGGTLDVTITIRLAKTAVADQSCTFDITFEASTSSTLVTP